MQPSYCFSSGCHNKVPRLGGLNDDLFLTVLEAEKSTIRVPVWSGSGENTLLVCRSDLSSHAVLSSQEGEKGMEGGEDKLSCVHLLIKALIPFTGAPTHMT